jgi:ABC-type nitrate/sulfonate/bicarbonate transport system permease component
MPDTEAISGEKGERAPMNIDTRDLINRSALYVSIPLFLIVWQLISTSGLVNRILAPAPTDVFQALAAAAQNGSIVMDILWSSARVLVGYAVGAIAGILVGLLTARRVLLNNLLSPVLQLLRPIPPIAIVPLVIVWFGLTETGKYFLIAWGVFFVVWIATFMGVQKVNPLLIRAAQSLGIPERKMLREVIFPGALPYIVVGLRTSVTIAFYSLVAAEVSGSFIGLAYRINTAHQNMQTGLMMASLVMLGVLSAAADYGFNRISRRLVFWH